MESKYIRSDLFWNKIAGSAFFSAVEKAKIQVVIEKEPGEDVQPHDYMNRIKGWIPCSKRLPEKTGKYWCTFGGTNLTGIDDYVTESYAKKWFAEPEEYIGWASRNVVAWMPLPEPYKT